MEELLHFIWENRLFAVGDICAKDEEKIEVIDPGWHNYDAGPDFINAKIKINDTLWVGNIEIHFKSSDWIVHRHQLDKNYNNVILHVVSILDTEIRSENGRIIPQLVIKYSKDIQEKYYKLHQSPIMPSCLNYLKSVPSFNIRMWMSALSVERLEEKCDNIMNRWNQHDKNWEDIFFITLARNFGFGVNGDAFEYWSSYLPFRSMDKHRDNLFQIEAFFFGYAGLLNDMNINDSYYKELQKEFRYLCHKFSLTLPVVPPQWKMMRLRPYNFPHIRIAQLANIYHSKESLFSKVMEIRDKQELRELFECSASSYWKEHFTFGKESIQNSDKHLRTQTLDLILINSVAPFLFTYGRYLQNEEMCTSALELLEQLPPENNKIVRKWKEAGVIIETALDSQAIICIENKYCSKKDCLRCRIGYDFLSNCKQIQKVVDN